MKLSNILEERLHKAIIISMSIMVVAMMFIIVFQEVRIQRLVIASEEHDQLLLFMQQGDRFSSEDMIWHCSHKDGVYTLDEVYEYYNGVGLELNTEFRKYLLKKAL